MAKDSGEEVPGMESALQLLAAAASSFDYEAAENATPEQSRNMLKVLKHYVRAIKGGGRSVNSDLKLFLNCCAIEPEVPGSVAGGFKFAIKVLKATHTCSGQKCVHTHRKTTKKKKKVAVVTNVVDKDFKKSVKQRGVRVKGNAKQKPAKNDSSSGSIGNRREMPSYFI